MKPTKAQLEKIREYQAAGFREVESTAKGVVLVRARGDVMTAIRIQKNGKAVREVAHV
jgi:hypothetical protein